MTELTAARLREVLDYDMRTGVFRWRPGCKRVKPGDTAGSVNNRGYAKITVDLHCYWTHRLAWLYVYGHWPRGGLDHIDGDPSNNRIDNLREANDSQNQCNRGAQRNNTTGFKGVYLCGGKYRAQICVDGRSIELGSFSTAEEARSAYQNAAQRLHGAFANDGRRQK